MRDLSLVIALLVAGTATAYADVLDDAASWLSRTSPPQAETKRPTPLSAADPPPSEARSCRMPPVPDTTDGANKACLASAGALAAQRGDTLTLRMDDGSRKALNDKDPSGDTGYGFALVDFDPTLHVFTVADIGRDKATYRIIDGRTGTVTETGEHEPFLSPGGQWRFDVDAGPGTYVLYASADPATPIWDAKASKTDTNELAVWGWRNDRTLELTQSGKRLALVRADDGHWSIDDTLPPAPSFVTKPTRNGLAKDLARCGIEGDYSQADSVVGADACRVRLGDLSRHANGKLILQLASGKTTAFDDTQYEAGKPTPAFYLSSEVVAYSRAAHAFVVRQDKTDTGDGKRSTTFLTIDSRSGATRSYATYPYVSPDGSFALAIAPTGAMRLLDLAASGKDPIWLYPATAGEAVSPHVVFLGWDDVRRARLLIDDARILTLARGDDGAWSAQAEPLVTAFEAADKSCAVPKQAGAEDEARCLATIPELATREGGVLTLRLEDGRTTRTIDRDVDDGRAVIHRLAGYDSRHHQFIVAATYYEGFSCFVVDSISGERTDIGDLPRFSPDRSDFLVVAYDDGMPGVTIFANGAHPRKAWTYEPKAPLFEADFVGWLDEGRVKVKLGDKTAIVARDTAGSWHLASAGKQAGAPKREPAVGK